MSHSAPRNRGFGLNVETLGRLHWTAIGLAATTGLVHLYLFVDQGFLPFLLSGLGFLGWIALVAVTRGSYRHLLYLGGIPYALAQVVAFYVVEQPQSVADLSGLSVVTKLVEVVLALVLAYLFYTEWDGL